MINIIRVLHVFFLASGLKINVSKCNIYGLGVSTNDIENLARDTGCGSGNIPFSYLGLPLGVNMNLIPNWQPLIYHFRAKLSSWKACTLSIRGRLTLIKSVLGSLGIYYMSIFKTLEAIRASFFWGGSSEKKNMAWIKWENVLASFEKGGLNIGSLKSFNLALLQKWRWRLVNNSDSLWARVIIAIHDVEAGLVLKGCNCSGVWSSIISSYSLLHDRNFLPLGTLCRKVGNGTSIRFWKDSWNGNGPLMTRFNRLYHLDANKDCLLSDWNVNGSWVWSWKRQVVGSQNEVALNILVSDLGQTSTLLNLSLRGLEIPSILCPMCYNGVESVDHVFFGCELASNIWRLIRVTDIPQKDKNKAKQSKPSTGLKEYEKLKPKAHGEDPRAMMMDLESRDEIEAYGTLLKPRTFSSSL
ncbi:RNA-directed DNA polymerase, eukaryota, reverse transcriptase zinc-binding domain protein [Tanacetum coccineum]